MVDRDDTKSKSDSGDDFLDELSELFDNDLGESAEAPADARRAEQDDFGTGAAEAMGKIDEHDLCKELRDDFPDGTHETPSDYCDTRKVGSDDVRLADDELDPGGPPRSMHDDDTVPLELMWDADATNLDTDKQTDGGGQSGASLDEPWSDLELEDEENPATISAELDRDPWTPGSSRIVKQPDDTDSFEPLDEVRDTDESDALLETQESAGTDVLPGAHLDALDSETRKDPVEEPLSYAAKVAAESYLDFDPVSDQEVVHSDENNLDAELDPGENFIARADDALDLPTAEALDRDLVEEDIETDADLDLLGAGIVPESTPQDELDGLSEWTELEFEPQAAMTTAVETPVPAPGEVRASMPFDMHEPSESERIVVAPPVPAKRRAIVELAKLGLALVMGAFSVQMGLWWGAGIDPLGLAPVMPAWFIPSQLKPVEFTQKIQPRATPPAAPAQDPVTAAPSSPAAAATKDDDVESAETPEGPPQTPTSSDLNDEPGPENPPANDPDVETSLDADLDASSALETPNAPGQGIDSGSTDFELEQPEEAGQMTDFDAVPTTSHSLPANEPDSREPDTLLNDLGIDDTAPASDQADFDGLMGSPDTDSELAPELAADAIDDSNEAITMDAEALDAVAEPPSTARTRPLGAPAFTANDLAGAIAAARDADTALTNARINRATDLVKTAEQFYRSFASLAVTGTYLDRNDADEVLRSARELLSSFEFDEKKQRMIANATRNWIKARLGEGVFAAVTVEDVSRKGELFEVKATLMGKEALPITLLTPVDPGLGGPSGFTVGDRILVLGAIVEQPDRKIEGYSGAASSVVWFTDLAVAIPQLANTQATETEFDARYS